MADLITDRAAGRHTQWDGLQRALQQSVSEVSRTGANLGALPPPVGSLRGRTGLQLVKVVRRALFWLNPQLRAFGDASSEALRIQAAAITALMEETKQLRTAISYLKAQIPEGEPVSLGCLRVDERSREAETEAVRWMESVRQRGRERATAETGISV